jgi:hypothetical protein
MPDEPDEGHTLASWPREPGPPRGRAPAIHGCLSYNRDYRSAGDFGDTTMLTVFLREGDTIAPKPPAIAIRGTPIATPPMPVE